MNDKDFSVCLYFKIMPPKRTAGQAASAGGRKKGGAASLYDMAEPFSQGTTWNSSSIAFRNSTSGKCLF